MIQKCEERWSRKFLYWFKLWSIQSRRLTEQTEVSEIDFFRVQIHMLNHLKNYCYNIFSPFYFFSRNLSSWELNKTMIKQLQKISAIFYRKTLISFISYHWTSLIDTEREHRNFFPLYITKNLKGLVMQQLHSTKAVVSETRFCRRCWHNAITTLKTTKHLRKSIYGVQSE